MQQVQGPPLFPEKIVSQAQKQYYLIDGDVSYTERKFDTSHWVDVAMSFYAKEMLQQMMSVKMDTGNSELGFGIFQEKKITVTCPPTRDQQGFATMLDFLGQPRVQLEGLNLNSLIDFIFDELAKFEKEKIVLRLILIYTRDALPVPVSSNQSQPDPEKLAKLKKMRNVCIDAIVLSSKKKIRQDVLAAFEKTVFIEESFGKGFGKEDGIEIGRFNLLLGSHSSNRFLLSKFQKSLQGWKSIKK